MTLLDRVLAHTAETRRRQLARLNTPIRFAGRYGDEFQLPRQYKLDDSVDGLLGVRPYYDHETGRMIRCQADIDEAPAV
jgi:hypothetical protein